MVRGGALSGGHMRCDAEGPCASCVLAPHLDGIETYLRTGRRFVDVPTGDLVKVWSRMLAGYAVFRLEPLDLEAASSECLMRAHPGCAKLLALVAALEIRNPVS